MLMPELGESVTEGHRHALAEEGRRHRCEVDEPLVEVSTDKVDTEIPSPVAGTLVSITAEEDDTVAVGGELAKIGDAQAAGSSEQAPTREPEPEARTRTRTRTGTQARTEGEAGTETRTQARAETRTQAEARAAAVTDR